MCDCTPLILKQLECIVSTIAASDFPQNWDILSQIVNALQSGNPDYILIAAKGICLILSPFKLEIFEKREPINFLANNVFPKILPLIMNPQSNNEKAT